ncbi:hypothetical protein [uncultured Parabacteroides sp.]|uniref:hypothetical protein n=1 Tax=uncultured Parabacteroides sp. TaxID=512312 RepID=UPI002676F45B|nr:hypothetical protein [uncultured Parabacteroides sp.]
MGRALQAKAKIAVPITAGLTPILAHITTNGISKEIYIQCSVPADKWNQAKERATGKDKLC